MTTSSLMSLPIDIPWKRLGTSKDMMDNKPDRRYPIKWRSSLSIFYYEPPAEEQKFDDRIITYLKVSCTITGFQKVAEGPEVSMLPKDLLEPWKQVPWPNYYKTVRPYYPCYGAMLQVAVFPKGNQSQQFPLDKYPFILDFEPKKREMYESATEAKQFMSQSRAGINVKKGTTTTVHTEDNFNIGGFIKGSIGIASAGVNASGGRKWGTSTETVDLTTADYSREKRENYSYTTNLSHMYHLLKGYHLGTNRAMFLVLPRPHIMDTEYTFVNGPRRLEGIQEFFLTIERPKSIPGICVEATLETAHLEAKTVWLPRIIPVSDLYKNSNYMKTADALGLKESDKSPLAKQLHRIINGWWEPKIKLSSDPKNTIDKDKYFLKDDGQVCLRRGWNNLGLAERAELIEGYKKGSFKDVKFPPIAERYWYFRPDKPDWTKVKDKIPPSNVFLLLPGGDPWMKEDPGYLMGLISWVFGYNEDVGTLNAEVVYQRGYKRSGTLFLTGRTTTNCLGKPSIYAAKGIQDSLTYEKKIDIPGQMDDLLEKNAARAAAANLVTETIEHEMIESLSSPDRLPLGEVDMTEADFVQEPIRKALAEEMPDTDSYNVTLDKIEDLDPKLTAQLTEVFGVKTRKEALGIELYQLRAGLDLKEAEARRLRTELIGKGPRIEVRPGLIIVPNVGGTSLEEARQRLARTRLTANKKVTYQNSLEPRDTVLNQFPSAGTGAEKEKAVSLVVSSGPVTIPGVVGMSVDEATLGLERLSLRVEQTFAVSNEQPEGHVLGTTPSANTEAAQNSQVVLLVAQKQRAKNRKESSQRTKSRKKT